MRQYVIYQNPIDFPGKVVARGFTIGPGWLEPDGGPLYVGTSLTDARIAIARRDPGLIRISAEYSDEPQIVEVWI